MGGRFLCACVHVCAGGGWTWSGSLGDQAEAICHHCGNVLLPLSGKDVPRTGDGEGETCGVLDPLKEGVAVEKPLNPDLQVG